MNSIRPRSKYFCNPNKLDDLPRFEEVKNIVLNISDESSTVSQVTAEEAIQKGILPNKLVGYYLALLNEFYSKTGIDMKRTRFRRLSDEDKASMHLLHLILKSRLASDGWNL